MASKVVKKESKTKVKKTTAKPAAKVSAVKKPISKKSNLIAPMYDVKGAKNGSFSLPKEVFGAKINDDLMAQAVRVYLSNQRQGNAHTKSRGEIKLTTAKWFRQKGTGRARHGAKSAPIFVGGGVAHGPRNQNFHKALPKKMKKASLYSALSKKANDGEIVVVSGFSKIEGKTKAMNNTLRKITSAGKKMPKILIVASGASKELPNVYRASRNIENVEIINANLINTYEILKHKNLLLMKESVEVISGSGEKK